MGLLGRYIDGLSDRARDRLLEAQDWCVAELVGPDGARCLVGHAEDWRSLPAGAPWWRGRPPVRGGSPPEDWDQDVVTACSACLFAFRGARPGDLRAYRARVARWGLSGEALLGERFDRLLARRGRAAGVRLVKARAAARVASGRVGARRVVPGPAHRPVRAGTGGY
jgi:hypothetical protein